MTNTSFVWKANVQLKADPGSLEEEWIDFGGFNRNDVWVDARLGSPMITRAMTAMVLGVVDSLGEIGDSRLR
jgi:hypothetical protein